VTFIPESFKHTGTLTHCLVLEKVSGWIDQRKESLWENGIPPFGSCVREERLLNLCGSHGVGLDFYTYIYFQFQHKGQWNEMVL
jgi:hypothetical protein